MSASKKKACDQVVKKVHEILARRESDLVDAFLILRELEIGGDWRFAAGGDRGFDAFLQSNFSGRIPPHLYRKAVTAVGLYGEDFVRKVGVHSSPYLVTDKLAESARGRNRVKKILIDYVKRHSVAPTAAVVKKAVTSVFPGSVPGRRRSSAELLRENERLKAENEVLRAEKQKLEAEINLLRQEIRDLKAAKRPTRRTADPSLRAPS